MNTVPAMADIQKRSINANRYIPILEASNLCITYTEYFRTTKQTFINLLVDFGHSLKYILTDTLSENNNIQD